MKLFKKRSEQDILVDFFNRNPNLAQIREDLHHANKIMCKSFSQGGQLLVCGNGGSSADCNHIIVELLRTMELSRPITTTQRQAIVDLYPKEGEWIADRLVQGLPAISLVAQATMLTAMANDVSSEMMFAQQVFAYGKPGDMLLVVSTSGQSENLLHAVRVAQSLEMHTIAITGSMYPDPELKRICEVAICSPENCPANIQEDHVAIYHVLLRLIENHFFE